MKSVFAAALVPLCLAAQDPAPASAALQAWQGQHAKSVATYEADRTKERARSEKVIKDLERREDSWLQVARDVFGMTEAKRTDPDFLNRQRRQRHEDVRVDDSTAVEHIAARRPGDPAAVLGSFYARRGAINTIVVGVDTLLANARLLVRSAELWEIQDMASEGSSLLSQAQRDVIKRYIDYDQRLVRAARAQVDYYTTQIKNLRAELQSIEAQIQATKPLVPGSCRRAELLAQRRLERVATLPSNVSSPWAATPIVRARTRRSPTL